MKRVLLLLFVAVITFGIILLYKNPEVLKDIWLWLIGLAGSLIHLTKLGFNYLKEAFSGKKDNSSSNSKEDILKPSKRPSSDIEIQLLRYFNEDNTTIGLLYIQGNFYCYTIEDITEEGLTTINNRIPPGSYAINFDKKTDAFTEKYRTQFPEWFTYHLQIENVTQQYATYLHCGGKLEEKGNSVLVSNSLSIDDKISFISSSRNAFRTLYQFLSQELDRNKKVMITIKDESWVNNLAS